LVFYKTALSGEDQSKVPRWVGINNVANILDDTVTAIDKIKQNNQDAFDANDGDTTDLTDFENTLTDSYNTYSGSELDNPNPAISKRGSVTKITPNYITLYGDYNTNSTALNVIHKEFDTKLKAIFDLRQTAQDSSQEITDNADTIKVKIQDISSNINNFKEPFDTLSADVLDTWIEAVIIFNKYYYILKI
jgi:hypothetical protein